jgi:adenylate cyclase
MSAARIREIKQEYMQRMVLGGSLLAAVFGAMGAFLAGRLVRPMVALRAEMGRVGQFRIDDEVKLGSRVRELVELQTALSKMKKGLRSFRRYVPADLVSELILLDKEATLGGERRELTVFFSDIADFTQACESMPPERLSRFLTIYFEVVTKTIVRHGGTVDKYMGDAVMAFWNAPRHAPDHALRAVLASLEIQQKLASLQSDFEKRGWPSFSVRIGVSTGPALVGNVGYSERLSYTALGDTVNLAARMESLNKHFGTQILISESTAKLVNRQIFCREVDLVYVHGTTRPVAVFVPQGQLDQFMPSQLNSFGVYAAALGRYRAREWQAASDGFREFLRTWPDDGPANKLLLRCSDHLKFPPDAAWDGAVRLTVK